MRRPCTYGRGGERSTSAVTGGFGRKSFPISSPSAPGPRSLLTPPRRIWSFLSSVQSNSADKNSRAALSRDMEKLRQVFDPETGAWSAGPGLIPFLSHELKIEGYERTFTTGNEQLGPWEHREQMRLMTDMSDVHFIKFDVSLDEVQSVNYLAEATIRIITALVQDTLGPLVRPSFGTLAPHTLDTSRSWWEPELLTRSWVPVNLLGAMYLQFYWMMTSTGDLSRCKSCGQIISHAPSTTGSDQTRKPRDDKEFCDNRCRQNYHYHNRIKPARQEKNNDST